MTRRTEEPVGRCESGGRFHGGRWRRGHILFAAVVALGVITALAAASRNIAPDAVSRASTWNEHAGEVTWLTDGLAPPAEAPAFVWHSKGMLVFEWREVLPLAQVRVRLGEADSDFEVRTYIGGHLIDDGSTRDPLGERTATVQDLSGAADTWLVFDLPPGTRADNLEFKTQGRTELYEVEILVATDGTAVEKATWAEVKAIR